MDLKQLKKQLSKDLNKASNSKDLQDLKIKYLGKKGKISLLSKGLGKLSQSERPKAGKEINLLRVFFEEQSQILAKEIEQQEIDRQDARLVLSNYHEDYPPPLFDRSVVSAADTSKRKPLASCCAISSARRISSST